MRFLKNLLVKTIDVLFFVCIAISVFLNIAGKWQIGIFALSSPLAFLLLNTILIKLFKTTPGRMICGIEYCEKISWRKAFLLSTTYNTHQKNLCSRRPKPLKFILVSLLIPTLILFPYIVTNDTSNEINFSICKYLSKNDDWTEISSDEFGFVAAFPKEPLFKETVHKIPKTNKNIKFVEYYNEHDGIHYSLSFAKLLPKWTIFGSGAIFNEITKFASKKEGRVIKKAKSTHGKFPSLEYTREKGNGVATGKLVLVKNKLFKIEVTKTENNMTEVSPLEEKFINSFEPVIS